MQSHALRQRAWREGTALAAVVALIAAAGVYAEQRPTDATGLKAEISVVRSQAAEAALLAERARELDGRFVRAHAEQLAKNIERESKSLEKLDVQRSLADAHHQATAAALRLKETVKRWADDEASVGEAALPALVAELKAIEQSLRN